jgi:CHAD domain-containing protein
VTTDQDEIEWQFDAPNLRRVMRWLRTAPLPPAVALGPESVRVLVDTYFETDDWRLTRAGYALRVRQSGGDLEATMKALAGGEAGHRRRREISVAITPGDPERALERVPGLLAERIHAVAGRHSLKPILEIRTRRRARPVIVDGRPAGELALDRTVIPRGAGAEPVRLERVEVEVGEGTVDELAPFVEALQAGCRLQPAACSKLETGMRALGIAPSPLADLGPTAIDDSMTAGAVAFASARRAFAVLLAHEPATRLGDDIEALHQMRVATRRLRAALKLFADVLPARARGFHRTLGWIGGWLGAVRDLDVQLKQLRAWRAAMEPREAAALEAVAVLLRRRRLRARRRMLSGLDSRRYERFVAAFTAFLQHPPSHGTQLARMPILAVAPDPITRRYRRVIKGGDAIASASPPSEYHALRIRCKRLRYALEFHADVYGKPVRGLLRALAALQSLLGDHQDAEVAVSHLREFCETHGRALRPEAIFAIGKIAERYERRAVKLRRRFPKLYRRIVGQRWRKLRRALEERRPSQPGAHKAGGVAVTASRREARPQRQAPAPVQPQSVRRTKRRSALRLSATRRSG